MMQRFIFFQLLKEIQILEMYISYLISFFQKKLREFVKLR